jgi:hypothetical protein
MYFLMWVWVVYNVYCNCAEHAIESDSIRKLIQLQLDYGDYS